MSAVAFNSSADRRHALFIALGEALASYHTERATQPDAARDAFLERVAELHSAFEAAQERAVEREREAARPPLEAFMAGFSGTERYHRVTPARSFVVTDGVRAVAEAWGAFWLCDAIMSHAPGVMARDDFAVVRLTVRENASARLTIARDEPGEVYAEQDIPYTDFPSGDWRFYLSLGAEHPEGEALTVLMLTSEY
jgi:hypothetical protein